MKFLNSLMVLYLFCLFLSSCIQEDPDECVNALDCFNGWICVDGMCVDPEGSADDKDSIKDDNDHSTDGQNDSDISIDLDQIQDGTNDSDDIFNDTDALFSDEDDSEKIDETPDVDTFVDCEPGYHLEAEDDDEDGDGKRGCVKNVTCITEPCNGGQCTELEFTVTCKCTTGYAGRWCTDCDTGYLKSTVDSKCKADCDHGTYNCTGSKVCGIDPVKNEAGCVCAEYYSGTDCTVCDAVHFCNAHGTCSAPSGAPICSCTGNWTGNDCSQCLEGYIPIGGNCAEACDASCGQPGGFINQESHGECVYTSGTGVCQCDAGWKDPIVIFIPMVPECSECNKSSPPPEYATNGCPVSCKDDSVYALCGANGDCYYEKTGSNKRYCICDGGYHLDNGDIYSGTCIQ